MRMRAAPLLSSLFLVACAEASSIDVALSSDDGDAGAATAESVTSEGMLAARAAAPSLETSHPPAIRDVRAVPTHASAPSCALRTPAGACDRCPDRACRQVRLSLVGDPSEAGWAMFCEEGDLREEARIACLCTGAAPALCDRSAHESAAAILLLNAVFGGEVPAIGTRYYDAHGLRATVDESVHAWLTRIAGPERVLRCDEPDRDAAETRYEQDAQRVRTSGTCT